MSKMKPMLAEDADLSKLKYPVIIQPKIDGVRQCWLDDQPFATGRSLKRFPNQFVQKQFSDEVFQGFDGELALFGEQTSPSLCRDTTSAVMSHDGSPTLVWWLFDTTKGEFKNKPYKERLAALDALAAAGLMPHPATVMPHKLVYSERELMEAHTQYMQLGFEGSILRDPDGMYKSGRSTVNEGGYLRIKDFSDTEGLVIRIEEAMENTNEAKKNELGRTERSTHKAGMKGKGMVGGIVCMTKQWGEVYVGPGEMSHVMRQHYFENPSEIVGKTIKFKYFGHGIKSKPRFPTFVCIRPEEDMS